MKLTPAYGPDPEGGPARPAPATAREVTFAVYCFAQGDEAWAKAIIESLQAETGNLSRRKVAEKYGLCQGTLVRRVSKFRELMQKAVVWVGG